MSTNQLTVNPRIFCTVFNVTDVEYSTLERVNVPFKRGLVSIRGMLKVVTSKSQQVHISVNRDTEFQT